MFGWLEPECSSTLCKLLLLFGLQVPGSFSFSGNVFLCQAMQSCLTHVQPTICPKTHGVPINTYTVLFLHTFFFLSNLPHKFQLPQPLQTLVYACFLISARLPCSVYNPLPQIIESRNPGKSKVSPNLFSFSQESKFCLPVAQCLKKIASYILSSCLFIAGSLSSCQLYHEHSRCQTWVLLK